MFSNYQSIIIDINMHNYKYISVISLLMRDMQFNIFTGTVRFGD